MDVISYSMAKKYSNMVALGLASATVDDVNKSITFTLASDGSEHTIHFNQPSDGQDGISVTGISDKGNGVFTLLLSDGSESDPIQTVKGQKGDKGDKLTFNDLTDEEKASLKGDAGFSPTITENADNTDKIYKLDITTADSTFTTPNLKGADGQGGTGGGEENIIDSISVNGVNVVPDENKNVDIEVPNIYVGDTEPIDDSMEVWINPNGESSSIEVPIEKIKVNGELQTPVNKVVDIIVPDSYDDTALSNRVKSVEDEVPNLATKTYVGEQIANAEHLKREIVTVLPSDAEASDNIIYMLKVESATGNDKYKKYMKIDGTVQMVGDTSVDLTDYAKTVDIPTTVAELTDSADYAKKTDIPTTLPANGGNADTVGGFTVGVNVPADAKFTDTITEINDADVSKTTVWSSDKVASEIASAIAGGEVDLSAYQKKNDTGLCTMAQDIVGAINEVKEAVDGKINYDDTEVKADITELQTKAHTHANTEVLGGITSENIQSWNNKSEFDGNYNTLTNKPALPVKLSDLTNDSGYITNIVDDLLNYYKKSDTYSKEEIAELIGNINKLTSEIVESLPTENISTSTIYLIKEGDTNNYKQYMYISGAWAQLSDTNIDLSGYAKLTDLDTKVDKVTGKTLSTNDFTNVLKSKLDGIAEGANKTVVDAELSTTSTNPVQNAVVTTKINTLANKDGSDATGTWGIDISGTAAKATADKNGNDITTTYTKQADFEKAVGNVDIINYTDQIIKNTDVVAYMFSTNIRKVGHIVTFVINITVKAVPSSYVQLGTIPKGVRPPADVSYNILTNNGDACYVYIDSDGKFGIRKISATEFASNDGVRFCANYITEE